MEKESNGQEKMGEALLFLKPLNNYQMEEEVNKIEEETKPPTGDEKPVDESKEPSPPPQEMVLRVFMHCEGCARKLRRCLKSFEGVESAVPDLKNSQVTVKGYFSPSELVEYVYKRTGKHVVIVTQDPSKMEDDKKTDKGDDNNLEEKKVDDGGAKQDEATDNTIVKLLEMGKSEYCYHPLDYDLYTPIPQMFSDENPNAACNVM
ncbi:hypothetical protein QVD17_38782 [Tagetes erecta]|uniref:HMA domain-containing protein n=1 Tax=Tagetes erecta TaxID=13708 RepID=A0AAD8JMG1_TARER|nr:hypothetical protein QVD17_38782 [Tagetes erecta]